MKHFSVGDSVRFTATGITGKIVYIGQNSEFYCDDCSSFGFEDDEERYFIKISKDDVEMVVEGSDEAIFSFPITEGGVEKI